MRRLLTMLIAAVAVVSTAVGINATAAVAADGTHAIAAMSGFRHIVVDDAMNRVFLSSDGGLAVVDSSGTGVADSLDLGPVWGMALSADGATLYAALPSSNAIAVIDVATLSQTATIDTGTQTCPHDVVRLGSTLWFGYGCTGWSGAVGSVDLATNPATVVLDLSAGRSYSYAPLLAASSADAGSLFVAEPDSDPGRVDAYSIAGTTLTYDESTASSEPIGWTRDLAVSADGSTLLVATGSQSVLEYSTTDLSATGALVTDHDPVSVAPSPDGSTAAGMDDAYEPPIFTYNHDGSFRYQYGYGTGISADDGLAYNADGTTLYAVTAELDDNNDNVYVLHVLTDLTDTARPPAPVDVSANPDFRSIRLVWHEDGLFPYGAGITYTVYRGKSPTSLTALTTLTGVAGNVQVYVDEHVAADTSYYYKVTATNASGESDGTAVVNAIRDDRMIVFVTQRWADTSTDKNNDDLAYVSDHGGIHLITTDDGDYSDPVVSPNGSSVVYAVADGSDTHLWRIGLDGSKPHALTGGDNVDSQPAWSPDGKTIAFTRTYGGNQSIWTVPAAGGQPTEVPGTANDTAPTWSPNGNALAVLHGPSAAALDIVAVSGGYRRFVVSVASPYHLVTPSWSPDGATVEVVVASPTSGESHGAIVLVPVDGGPPTTLTPPDGYVQSATWSPDGTRIVYSDAIFAGDYQLTAIAADGSGSRTVYAYSVDAAQPSAYARPMAYLPTTPRAPHVFATIGDKSVSLAWKRPANAAYVVVRGSEPGGPAPTSPTGGIEVYSGTATHRTVTGLYNGKHYAFAVFAYTKIGDRSSATVVRAAPAATPRVSPQGSILDALIHDGPAFTARWQSYLRSGQTYQVEIGQRHFDGRSSSWSAPTWRTLERSTALAHAAISGVPGNTYYLRARVLDGYGHATTWSSPSVAPVPYDDRAFTESAQWSRQHSHSSYEHTLTTTTHRGAWLTATEDGSAFTILASTCRSCGSFRVYVDGHLRDTVSTHAARTSHVQPVWTTRFGKIGTHTVRLVTAGTAHHPAVKIDGLISRR